MIEIGCVLICDYLVTNFVAYQETRVTKETSQRAIALLTLRIFFVQVLCFLLFWTALFFSPYFVLWTPCILIRTVLFIIKMRKKRFYKGGSSTKNTRIEDFKKKKDFKDDER